MCWVLDWVLYIYYLGALQHRCWALLAILEGLIISHLCASVCMCVCVCVCWWVGASVHMPEICKPNSWLLGDLRCKVNHTPGSWLKSLLAHARVPSWLSDDFFFFLIWTIFKVFIEFVTILLLFYVLVFWLQGILGSGTQLANPSLRGKVLTTGPPRKTLYAIFFFFFFWKNRWQEILYVYLCISMKAE